ncbi:hypothetical protein EMPS_04994 [Entomortierella parvispora]|uniref:tRNA/rRNA methyltransferase SpoU type domain-containing protein n=1 Tax=Entomortierella parvispora TaxID=205924 RepID=A0A9P3H9F8_9FUNG|nr:hypothetical protein EMPS_04994 [Entomortierella parvispora]
MQNLPNRFLRITGSKNQLLRRLELLRVSKSERQSEGHVLVQGIKTVQELANKGHSIRTLGITYDENNLPIQSPALDIVQGSTILEREPDRSSSGTPTKPGSIAGKIVFKADQYVAASRKLTTRILGTDSRIAEHEVWAEVAIPDYGYLFSPSGSSRDVSGTATATLSGRKKSHRPSWMRDEECEIQKMLVLDRISDPGNMGLLIRAGMALNWHGSWHTPGTVDEYNNKVVRASRALCLDWPTKTGGWKELGEFLEGNGMTLLVADMIPRWILDQSEPLTAASAASSTETSSATKLNMNGLVWWNWPDNLPRTRLPSKVALLMGSEHHGVNIGTSDENGAVNQDDQKEKDRLLEKAIRVSIPMNAAVESMNVATAATAMMWELNRLLSQGTAEVTSSDALQIFDRLVK